MTSVDYVRNLVRLVPSLLPAMDEHLKDNDEMLPHVFFGDLTRVVINMQKMSDENQRYDNGGYRLSLTQGQYAPAHAFHAVALDEDVKSFR
jgi:hypothetical protein